MSAATLTVYYERLRRLNVKALSAAVDTAIDHNRYFPSIAEILENAAHFDEAPGNTFKALNEPRPTPEEAAKNANVLWSRIKNLANEKKI